MYGIKRTKKNFCQGAFFPCMSISGMIQAVSMLECKNQYQPLIRARNGGLSLQQTNPPKSSLLAFQLSGRLLLFEWGVCHG